MTQLTLTPDQVRTLAEAHGPVEVLDPDGRLIASMNRLDALDVAALERHRKTGGKSDRKVPADQVEAHLRRLAEIRDAEGMDEAKALDLLRRMRAGEAV